MPNPKVKLAQRFIVFSISPGGSAAGDPCRLVDEVTIKKLQDVDSIFRTKLPMEEVSMQQVNAERHWSRTSALMWIMMFLWFVFSFAIHYFVNELNSIVILGFPLGFYMAAQGSLLVFVIMLFVFQKRQDSIDRQEGVAEE